MYEEVVEKSSDWDFGPVLDVIQKLKRVDGATSKTSRLANVASDQGDILNTFSGLFDSVANLNGKSESKHGAKTAKAKQVQIRDEFGGVPLDLPPIAVLSWGSDSKLPETGFDNAYTSDVAVYRPTLSQEPGWMSEGDLSPSKPGHLLNLSATPAGLTKNQRKKRNRKLRLAEAANEARQKQSYREANDGNDGDDDDSGNSQEQTQVLPTQTIKKENEHVTLPEPSKAVKNTATKKDKIVAPVPPATPQTIQQAKAKVAAASSSKPPPATAGNSKDNAKTSAKSVQKALNSQYTPVKSYISHMEAKPAQPIFTAVNKSQLNKTGATPNKAPLSFPQASGLTGQHASSHSQHEILPLVNLTSVERNWSLLSKLLTNFPDDRKYLVAPLQLSINRPQPNGIHVFVDASNILIGFFDHLKLARGIPVQARVNRVKVNFHALALLLERRRPIAKRVLAGSTPEVPAFEQARQVGYETCILEKVFKTPYSVERKKRRKQQRVIDDNFNGYGGFGYVSGGYESAGNALSADDNDNINITNLYGAKWVEQAVDEVLHKKILESIVDIQVPPNAVSPYELDATAAAGGAAAASKPGPARPTMVLATGDAADAEYGSGFKDTIVRALRSGWMVEVMAFSKNISSDYRRMAKLAEARGGWGSRFKIIELDPYAEELFGEGLDASE